MVVALLLCATSVSAAQPIASASPMQTYHPLHAETAMTVPALQQRVELDAQNAPLRDVLRQIGQQSGVNLSYDPSMDALDQEVTVQMSGRAIDALQAALVDVPLEALLVKPSGMVIIRPEGSADTVAIASTLSGVVTDSQTGDVLPGVNVFLEETQQGVATDGNGRYRITGIEPGSYTLVASFIGYKRYTRDIDVGSDEKATVDIVMEPSLVQLDGVTVNALGFEESRDQQGAATSQVGQAEIERSGQETLAKALSAKASGVRITSTSGDPGSSARILIRGARSLGDNQPLIVVDGTPVSAGSPTNNDGGAIETSRINDINPSDIASVEVLKGPSAAALWGSRAANGVILIKTKQGARGGGLDISFKSSVRLDEVNRSVPLQQSYGQGRNGNWDWNNSRSWGDRIADRSGEADVFSDDPGEENVIVEKNSRETFNHSDEIYGTGALFDNTLSLSGGTEESRFYLSLSNLAQDGIIDGRSGFDRTSIRVNAERDFGEKFRASVNTSVVKSSTDRVQQGVNVTGVMLGMLRTPPDFNNRPYEIDYTDADGNTFEDLHRSFRNGDGSDRFNSPLVPPGTYVEDPGFGNPFWSARFNQNTESVSRAFGSTDLTYEFLPQLSLVHRLGFDFYEDETYQLRKMGNATEPTGTLSENVFSRLEVNSDLILRGNYAFNKDLTFSGLLGWNLNHRDGHAQGVNATGMVFRGVPRDIENFQQSIADQNDFTVRTGAFYGEFQWDFFQQLYLDLTGRVESASTFGPEAQSTFFYPSASLAWQFSKLEFIQEQDILSFGKLRASYGEAGVQPPPYVTNTAFFNLGVGDSGFGADIESRQYGTGFGRSQEFGNPLLVPERTREFEFGGDFRFLNDRVTFSATRYMANSTNVILDVDIAPSSGFGEKVVNSVELESTGIELEASSTWIQRDDFSWNTFANWSRNRTEVTDLAGVESIELSGLSVDSRAAEGLPFGVIWGGRWERGENGEQLLDGFGTEADDQPGDPGYGFPNEADENGPIGDPNPDWELGFGNTLQYRGATLSFLFDIRQGGDVWNGTRGVLYSYGTHADVGNETFVPTDQAGSIYNYDGESVDEFGTPATQGGVDGFVFRGDLFDYDGGGPAPTVARDEEWYRQGLGNHFDGPAEQFVEDGSYVRLRELSLSYNWSPDFLESFTGSGSSIRATVIGRNLWLLTDYSGIDPETNVAGSGNGRGLDYFNNPSTRSYTFSLQFNY